jgi:lipopolysaccharide biosynthesis glycosyltransferase
MFGFLVDQTKKAMRHNDQDALNMMLADKRWSSLHHVLGSEWNYGYATMEKAPPSGHIRIRHFMSSKGKYLKKYL